MFAHIAMSPTKQKMRNYSSSDRPNSVQAEDHPEKMHADILYEVRELIEKRVRQKS